MKFLVIRTLNKNKSFYEISFNYSEDDLVIFELVAENVKLELDNILKANNNLKSDFFRFNRKKFLLSYCYDLSNSNNQIEINSYLDEIVSTFRSFSS